MSAELPSTLLMSVVRVVVPDSFVEAIAACRLDYPFAERLAARDALPQVVPEVGAAAEVWYVPARDLVGRRVSNVHGAV